MYNKNRPSQKGGGGRRPPLSNVNAGAPCFLEHVFNELFRPFLVFFYLSLCISLFVFVKLILVIFGVFSLFSISHYSNRVFFMHSCACVFRSICFSITSIQLCSCCLVRNVLGAALRVEDPPSRVSTGPFVAQGGCLDGVVLGLLLG